MASHSDGSNSDDTWLLRDGTAIYNHPHKCHRGKARNKEVEEQQVGIQIGRRIEKKRQKHKHKITQESSGEKDESTEADPDPDSVSANMQGVGYVWLNTLQKMS